MKIKQGAITTSTTTLDRNEGKSNEEAKPRFHQFITLRASSTAWIPIHKFIIHAFPENDRHLKNSLSVNCMIRV